MVSTAERHQLSNIDADAQRATCSVCGPTDIHKKGFNRGQSSQMFRCKQKQYLGGRGIHGLTAKEAQAYVAGKSCEICGSTQNLCVDHDHGTGVIRGVLCIRCNTGLGKLGDSIEGLKRALVYLESA